MYVDLLLKIENERKKYNLLMQPGLEKGKLDKLVYESVDKLNYKITSDYINILKETDGIFYNGIEIYASESQNSVSSKDVIIEGFIEANETWRDDVEKSNYIIFAESGDALYVYNLISGLYEYVDRITLDVTQSFQTGEVFFELILNHILGFFED
jgi:hypothetical protein